MTMRAIDAQHMVARSTDFIRESSAIQKQPEINQTHLAANARQHDTEQQQKVQDLVEGALVNLSPDDNREHGGMGEPAEREKNARSEEDESEEPGTVVPAAKHIIDITI